MTKELIHLVDRDRRLELASKWHHIHRDYVSANNFGTLAFFPSNSSQPPKCKLYIKDPSVKMIAPEKNVVDSWLFLLGSASENP